MEDIVGRKFLLLFSDKCIFTSSAATQLLATSIKEIVNPKIKCNTTKNMKSDCDDIPVIINTRTLAKIPEKQNF